MGAVATPSGLDLGEDLRIVGASLATLPLKLSRIIGTEGALRGDPSDCSNFKGVTCVMAFCVCE